MTNTNDAGPGSLRQAILDAHYWAILNDNAPPAAYNIAFAVGVGVTIALSTGELLIADDLTITGPGARYLSIDAQYSYRLFDVNLGVTARISGLTITGRVPRRRPRLRRRRHQQPRDADGHGLHHCRK